VTTRYYEKHLAELHQRLLGHAVVQTYLTGTGIRFDGAELSAADRFELPFGMISTLEFAHLFSVFDGSGVHQQAEKKPSHDDAPPGMYFTVINNRLIQSQHKNRAGLVTEEVGTTDLYIESLHIDHFFLNERNTPPSLGTFAFALSAITAHRLGSRMYPWSRQGAEGSTNATSATGSGPNWGSMPTCCRASSMTRLGRSGARPCKMCWMSMRPGGSRTVPRGA